MIVMSVLNRLVSDPDSLPQDDTAQFARNWKDRGKAVSRSEFDRYCGAVRRDLEWLLNTRRIAEPVPEGMRELERSLYFYGLPDFSTLNLRSEGERNRLAATIARVVALFEPRILDPRVTVESEPSGSQDVHFHVFGRLKMKPRPEPVCYDTRLDVARGEYEVAVLGEERA